MSRISVFCLSLAALNAIHANASPEPVPRPQPVALPVAETNAVEAAARVPTKGPEWGDGEQPVITIKPGRPSSNPVNCQYASEELFRTVASYLASVSKSRDSRLVYDRSKPTKTINGGSCITKGGNWYDDIVPGIYKQALNGPVPTFIAVPTELPTSIPRPAELPRDGIPRDQYGYPLDSYPQQQPYPQTPRQEGPPQNAPPSPPMARPQGPRTNQAGNKLTTMTRRRSSTGASLPGARPTQSRGPAVGQPPPSRPSQNNAPQIVAPSGSLPSLSNDWQPTFTTRTRATRTRTTTLTRSILNTGLASSTAAPGGWDNAPPAAPLAPPLGPPTPILEVVASPVKADPPAVSSSQAQVAPLPSQVPASPLPSQVQVAPTIPSSGVVPLVEAGPGPVKIDPPKGPIPTPTAATPVPAQATPAVSGTGSVMVGASRITPGSPPISPVDAPEGWVTNPAIPQASPRTGAT
jgi:hypothetical protein